MFFFFGRTGYCEKIPAELKNKGFAVLPLKLLFFASLRETFQVIPTSQSL
jgi:hypothetical protein